MKNSTTINFDKIKLTRKSHKETHRIYGEVNLYINGSTAHDVEALGELFIKQGGEFRATPFKFKANVCNSIQVDDVFWPSIIKKVVPEPGRNCDNIYAGTYKINGFQPDMSHIPPVLRSGDYKATFKYIRNGKVGQQLEGYFHVININGGFIGL